MTATALIIDDEPDIRELIALTLTRMGLEHHSAANLEEARQLLSTYDFDVCLTDMRLPDGNGVDFVRYIQSKEPNLPVMSSTNQILLSQQTKQRTLIRHRRLIRVRAYKRYHTDNPAQSNQIR